MKKVFDISDFDIRIDVYAVSNVGTGQQIDEIAGSATYTNVWSKEVKSELTNDREFEEDGQIVSLEKRSFAIRKNNMTITNRQAVKVVGETNYFHVVSVHPYGSDRDYIVLECEARDNDA